MPEPSSSDGIAASDRRLIEQALDGSLSPDEAAAFRSRISTDPQCAEAFARALLLEDHLGHMLSAQAAPRSVMCAVAREATPTRRLAPIAAALVMAMLLWLVPQSLTTAFATGDLARIAARTAASDRTYRIRGIDDTTSSLEGATLHVRGGRSYVLIRGAGSERTVSGSDGATAWFVPADGPVRVSGDPRRFRGLLPGEQHDLPFLDLADDLASLAARYRISVRGHAPHPSAHVARIEATRRDDVRRGPKRVVIDYDPHSGVVQRMVFDRLPQAKGGPRSVELTLESSDALPDDFFSHAAHHDAQRRVLPME